MVGTPKPYGFRCKTHRILSLMIGFHVYNYLLFCIIQILRYSNIILLLCRWVSMFASVTWSRCSIDKFGNKKIKILFFCSDVSCIFERISWLLRNDKNAIFFSIKTAQKCLKSAVLASCF